MDAQERNSLVTEIANRVFSSLEPRLEKIEDEIAKVVRRQEEQSKTLDVMDKDREIMEDGLGVMRTVHQLLRDIRDHQYAANRNLDTKLQAVEGKIDQNPDDIKKIVSANMESFIEVVEKSKKVVVKNGWFDRFSRWIR